MARLITCYRTLLHHWRFIDQINLKSSLNAHFVYNFILNNFYFDHIQLSVHANQLFGIKDLPLFKMTAVPITLPPHKFDFSLSDVLEQKPKKNFVNRKMQFYSVHLANLTGLNNAAYVFILITLHFNAYITHFCKHILANDFSYYVFEQRTLLKNIDYL